MMWVLWSGVWSGPGYLVLASAPVLKFLDSHVECNEGWLEPLLAQVIVDRNSVTA